MRSLFTLAFLSWSVAVAAEELVAPPVRLSVPAGFQGPVRQTQDQATVVAYSRPRPDGRLNVLMQVTILELGSKLASVKPEQRGTAAEKYVLDFLGGVERRRSNFRRGAPQRVTLAGVPGAKVQWTGEANGMELVGVMYCVVLGSAVVAFHTQDLGAQPSESMIEVMKSFETAKLQHGG